MKESFANEEVNAASVNESIDSQNFTDQSQFAAPCIDRRFEGLVHAMASFAAPASPTCIPPSAVLLRQPILLGMCRKPAE